MGQGPKPTEPGTTWQSITVCWDNPLSTKKNNVEALCITHNPKKAFVSRSNSRLTTTETTDDVCGEIGSRVRSPESRHQRESEHTPGFWDCLLSVRELCDKHGKLLNTFGGGKDTALIGTSKLRMGGFEG